MPNQNPAEQGSVGIFVVCRELTEKHNFYGIKFCGVECFFQGGSNKKGDDL